MTTIELPCFGIKVIVDDDGGGSINSDLHERNEDIGTVAGIDEGLYNCMIDSIESLILAHAVAGVDISSPAYIDGIETAVEACANQ